MKEETTFRSGEPKESKDMKLITGKDINISTAQSGMETLKLGESPINITDRVQYLKPINADMSHIDLDHYKSLNNFDKPLQEFFRNSDDLNRIFVINFSLKYDLFDIIEGKNNCDRNYIAEKLNLKEYSLDCLNNYLDQLYFFGYLNRSGCGRDAIYSNSEYSKKYFLKNSPDNYSKIYYNLYQCIKRLDMVEKNIERGNYLLYSDDIYQNDLSRDSYYDYFYKANDLNFDNCLKSVDFSQFKKICDLHGGRGIFGSRMKKCCPNIEVISFENSRMKDYVDSSLKGEKLGLRFAFGDLFKDEIPECDCFFLPQLLIHFNKEHKRSLIKNCYNQLNPGGQIVIMENLLDDDRNTDSCANKMNFMFGMMGYQGLGCTFNEYKEILNLSGFKFIERLASKSGMCDIILAKKAIS
jgi:hypothetical protein